MTDTDPTPSPTRFPRADGWTAERQRCFIEALADTGSVTSAAAAVGMSRESAYRLRRRSRGEAFDAACEAALGHATRLLVDTAFERALNGVPVPIVARGEIIGERRVPSERLLMFLLRHHAPFDYGALEPPKPYDARKLDPLPGLLGRLPKLLAEIMRRGRAPEPAADAADAAAD